MEKEFKGEKFSTEVEKELKNKKYKDRLNEEKMYLYFYKTENVCIQEKRWILISCHCII